MKYTLLEIVQDILSSTDGDEINSISDTTESQQIVTIVKTVYDDLLSRGGLAVYKTLFNLDSSLDPLKPVLMTKPANIDTIEWLKYNRVQDGDPDTEWAELRFIPLDDFICRSQGLNTSESDTDSMTLVNADGFTVTFNYKNNVSPSYFTTFDDNTVIFDSFDSAVDSTLQTVKTLGYGSKTAVFVPSDSWTPALQPSQFALLLNEAKSLAWSELKQTPHNKAEQTARRNWRHLSKTREHIPMDGRVDKSFRMNPIDHFPTYSRR